MGQHSFPFATTGISSLFILLTFLLLACPDAGAQEREVQQQSAAQAVTLKSTQSNVAELSRFCDKGRPTSSKQGGKKTYTCKSKSASTVNSIQAKPAVERAEIDCSYSEAGGVTKWLGCTCKENGDGNCNNFISNCVEAGDDVSGNSGSASCGPSGG